VTRKETPDGLPPLGDVIRGLGLSAKKSLGQNFILDLNLTRRIARAAALAPGASAVEIGPGPGGLTRALLLEGATRVVAIEADARCRPALEAIAARYPGRLEVHVADARTVAWERFQGSPRPTIVANLPYNIATTLLVGWLTGDAWPPWYRRMLLMFQQEVAERIVAAPATKAYGRLAVLAQWRTRPRLRFKVPATAFTPQPKVASALVEFEPIERPHPPCSASALGKVTAAAFGQRRKMLRQSLRALAAEPETLLAAAGIAATLRGEMLSVNDFARLAYVWERLGRRSP
jgi:16S rRNA (adenine1518-N6/adenine1519-N6)-dimethyltransferase